MAGEDEDQGLGFSQTEVAPGVINFAVGTPGASLIPKQDLDAAFAAALAANNDPLIYQYARIEGTLAFRQSLADFLNAHGCPSPVTGFRIAPENLCVSFGNSLALATIAVSILEFSFVYVCGHMHVCMYACMHVCMYACMHVCMYACMHVCVCYVCMMYVRARAQKLFARPGRCVVVEEPTYFLAGKIFADAGEICATM